MQSGGDNIAPARPEASLPFQETIFQSMVIGDRRPYLVAVIVPEVEKTKNLNEPYKSGRIRKSCGVPITVVPKNQGSRVFDSGDSGSASSFWFGLRPSWITVVVGAVPEAEPPSGRPLLWVS